MAETDNYLSKSLPNMEVEEATRSPNGDQAGVSSIGQSQDAIETLTEGSRPDSQTNGTEAALNGKSPKSPGEQEQHKKGKEPEKESPRLDGNSKRVREGQKWNDRPHKKYGNQYERPHKKHNNKSDLVSQQESSDPVAIRKQVCTSHLRYSFTVTNDNSPGRILLLRLQSSDRQISIHESRRP